MPRPPTRRARPEPPARQRLRRARDGVTRRAVLEAAEAAFAEHGFADARMQDVAAGAGVSLKTLYGLFEGKAALFTAVRESRRDALLEALAATGRAGGDDPRAQLDAGIETVVRFLVAHPDFLRIQLREGDAWAFEPRRIRAHRWSEVMRHQTALFEQGRARGVFLDEDPELLARLVTATIQVMLGHWLEAEGPRGDPAALVARVQDQATRSVCPPEPP